ncbi:hypothetical protein C4K39_5012 [Pseudomonas sessilinigenes]|nr:hypothetical protein C4K39_5012 [Pseudomonas sessilinigenes]
MLAAALLLPVATLNSPPAFTSASVQGNARVDLTLRAFSANDRNWHWARWHRTTGQRCSALSPLGYRPARFHRNKEVHEAQT